MEEYKENLENKISELKALRNTLAREANRQAWIRRISYFAAGWGFYKLISRRSTALSNIILGSGLVLGHGAGKDIDSLASNYSATTMLIEEKEKELKDIQKLEEEQKELTEEETKKLVLKPVK